MRITMNMSSYAVELDSMEQEYGEEVMSAEWNPAVGLVSLQEALEISNRQKTLPADLATVDAELFLQNIYVNQR